MKKKMRKFLLTLSAALLLVTMTVGVTIAYLTDTTEVVQNTFTIGDVQLTLDETKVDEYGVAVEDAGRVTENKYKLLPGHVYTKDPTVHVTETSEPAYVRMFVQITDLDDLLAACDKTAGTFLPQDFVNGWDPDVWRSVAYTVDTENDVVVCEFWYKEIVDARNAAKDLEPLFTEIKVPGNATNEEIEALKEMKINVVAQAIQSDSFIEENGKTAEENAWAAASVPSFEKTTTPDAGNTDEGTTDEGTTDEGETTNP